MLGKIGAAATKSSLLNIWSSKSHAVGCWRMFPRIMEVIRLLQTPLQSPFCTWFQKIHWHLMFPKPCSSHLIIFIQGPGAFSVSIDHLEKLSASVCSCELISWQWCTAQDLTDTKTCGALDHAFCNKSIGLNIGFRVQPYTKIAKVMPNNVFRWSNRYDGIEQGIWAMLLWSL